MTPKPFFINVNLADITAKGNVYNSFDFEIVQEMYDTVDTNGVPIVYNFMYKYILQCDQNKLPVVFSPDPAISASTIAANAEKHMYTKINGDNPEYYSNLKIIYLTATTHILNNYDKITVENLSNSVVSNLLCQINNGFTYTKHKLALQGDQFIVIGLNDNIIDDDSLQTLDNYGITYLTLSQMRKKTINSIVQTINSLLIGCPVHVVFDMSVLSMNVAPCVTRFVKNKTNTDGLVINEIIELLKNISNENLIGIDITGYDFRINNTDRMFRITCEAAKLPLIHLLKMQDKKINVFTEDSKFLIFRPIDQEDSNDVMWYILRNVSLDLREQLIAKLDIDEIYPLKYKDDDGEIENVYVSTTTINEQQQKTYYDETLDIFDCVLDPDEKIDMTFEMLNTANNSIIID